jgi:hypothetical protein
VKDLTLQLFVEERDAVGGREPSEPREEILRAQLGAAVEYPGREG